MLAIRFWAADEGVYDANGGKEPGYHPNPAGKALIAQLAASVGGRSYEEAGLREAAGYLRQIVGSGRTVTTRLAAGVRTLAPFAAGLAVLLLTIALATAPTDLRGRRAVRRILRAGGRLAGAQSAGSKT